MLDEKMKRIHSIMLEEFKILHNICEKNNIRYVANGGTCLGAIREKGFIPWDDDVDIMFLRSDYNKLKSIIDNELVDYNINGKKYYFTDYGGVRGCDLVLDVNDEILGNTTVGIGCIIYDKLPKSKLKQKIMRYRLVCYRLMIDNKRQFNSKLMRIVDKLMLKIGKIKTLSKVQRDNEKIATKYNSHKNKYRYYISTNDVLDAMLNKNYPVELFEERILVPFEDTQIYVPKEYDKYLTLEYGDYMKRPPVEQQVPGHNKF